jgi:hypothetical protein
MLVATRGRGKYGGKNTGIEMEKFRCKMYTELRQ